MRAVLNDREERVKPIVDLANRRCYRYLLLYEAIVRGDQDAVTSIDRALTVEDTLLTDLSHVAVTYEPFVAAFKEFHEADVAVISELRDWQRSLRDDSARPDAKTLQVSVGRVGRTLRDLNIAAEEYVVSPGH